MVVEDAKEAITAKLEKMGVAKRTVNYKFREWIFARQRYWGCLLYTSPSPRDRG